MSDARQDKPDRTAFYGLLTVIVGGVLVWGGPVVEGLVEDPPACAEVIQAYVDIYEENPGVLPPVDADANSRCGVGRYLEQVQEEDEKEPAESPTGSDEGGT